MCPAPSSTCGVCGHPLTNYTYQYQHGDNTDYDDPVATKNAEKTVKKENQGQFLLMDPSNSDCSLSFRDARISDRRSYFFRVERGNNMKYDYYNKKLTLKVAGMAEAWERTQGLGTRF